MEVDQEEWEKNPSDQVVPDAKKKIDIANAMIIAGIVLPILVGVGLGIAHHWVAHQKIGAIGLSSGTLVVTALLIGSGVWIRQDEAIRLRSEADAIKKYGKYFTKEEIDRLKNGKLALDAFRGEGRERETRANWLDDYERKLGDITAKEYHQAAVCVSKGERQFLKNRGCQNINFVRKHQYWMTPSQLKRALGNETFSPKEIMQLKKSGEPHPMSTLTFYV